MTVVVGVDNSAASRAALRLAAQEARWRQVPLVAVTAYEPPLGPAGGYPIAAKHTEGEQRATATCRADRYEASSAPCSAAIRAS